MISGRLLFFGLCGSAALLLLLLVVQIVLFLYGSTSERDIAHSTGSDYDRSFFGGWRDLDEDCLDTRGEILVDRSLTEAVLDETGCRIVGGIWRDFYTGKILSEPATIEIDHLVPLKEAWNLGAYEWDRSRAADFANDPENLVITTSEINRSKGSNVPPDWLPFEEEFRCEYVTRFGQILGKYGFALPTNNQGLLEDLRNRSCS